MVNPNYTVVQKEINIKFCTIRKLILETLKSAQIYDSFSVKLL